MKKGLEIKNINIIFKDQFSDFSAETHTELCKPCLALNRGLHLFVSFTHRPNSFTAVDVHICS